MRAARGHLRRAFWWTLAMFVMIGAAWLGSEARHPGQQYPAPFEPVAFLAVLFGPAFYLSWWLLFGRRRKG